MSYTSSLFLITGVTVLLAVVGFPVYLRYKLQYKLNPEVIFGVFFGMVAAVLVVHSIVFISTYPTQIYGELASLAGASLGWLIGMWLSPIGSTESTKFSKYWTAIGVGSGFTLKWAMERVSGSSEWIKGHPAVCLLFAVPLLVTTAAVYNRRAYEDSLTIAPRKPLPISTAVTDDFVEVKVNTSAVFYTTCVGPSDPLTRWEVIPASLGVVDALGLFTAAAVAGSGKITAFNVEDPTLSNAIAVKVVT